MTNENLPTNRSSISGQLPKEAMEMKRVDHYGHPMADNDGYEVPADFRTDDAKLFGLLLRSGIAWSAFAAARETDVDPEYAEQALAQMAAPESDWQVIRRFDLGPDVYEAITDDAREGER